MDQAALKLCATFSRQPNHLGYCGRTSAQSAFQACLTAGDCTAVPAEIDQFIVLNPYLATIAEITGYPKLSYPVVEAFWLGNDLLKLCRPDHCPLLLKNLKAQGVPEVLLAEAQAHPPKSFIPIHLFNIIHIGVGRASGSVPFTLHSINQCMIRWGKITRLLSDRKAQVDLFSLSPDYRLIKQTEVFPARSIFTPDLTVGNTVSVHWGEIACRLNRRQTAQLAFWTNRFLAAL